MLNEKQQEAVDYRGGPMLILAGAGSGKTLTLVSRVSSLIESGVSPESILLLTFTNKAADEMKERAVKILDERADRVLACTFHSFCNKMLREYADKIGIDKEYTIITPSDSQDAVRLIKAESPEKYKKRGFLKDADVVALFSKHVNTGLSFRELLPPKINWLAEELQLLFNKYRVYKEKQDILDFDDLLVKFLKLLNEREDVRRKLCEQYEHILVDEYQDTNKLQESILFKLNTKNLTVVGDDYQSLYAFRGADIDNILSFPDKVSNCKTVTLTENYRSGQEILDLANAVMLKNANFGFRKKMHGQYKAGKFPLCIEAATQIEEGEIAFNLIKDALERGIEPSEIAVLSRTSFWTYPLEHLLEREGIPYDKYGGPKFFEQECILDVLAYLRCIVNPIDQLAWFRVLSLYPGIGDKYASDISGVCNQRDFLIENEHKKKKFYDELVGLDGLLKTLEGMPFKEKLAHLIAEYIVLKRRCAIEGNFQSEEAREEANLEIELLIKPTLAQLYMIAVEYDDIIKFLDSLTLDQRNDDEEDKLVISTIHSIKGLEYEMVIILGCADMVFPSTTKDEKGEKDDMEELRCLYVALTRAKNELYILWPHSALVGGKWRKLQRSHHLEDCNFLMIEKNL